MQFSSLLFFSVSTPPSRKRQGGVKRVPQALQACILTSSSYSSPITPIHNPLVPRSSSLVPINSPLLSSQAMLSRPQTSLRHDDDVLPSTHPSPLSARWQARVHSRVVDTAVPAVPEVQQSWVTPGLTSERFNLVKFSTLDTSFGDARL